MAEDADDRTEAATSRQITKAREQGQVPRSRELSTFAVTITGVALLLTQGGAIGSFIMNTMKEMLTFNQATIKETATLILRLKESLLAAMSNLLLTFGTLVLVGILAPMLVGGWNFTFNALEPKFSKLNPLNGLSRLFSLSSATEALKAVLKSVLIGGIATWVIWRQRRDIIGLISAPLESGIAKMFDVTFYTFFIVVAAMVLLVAIDVPYTIWSHYKELRMSKQDVKQEQKEVESPPEVKSRIRQMQREAARKRMMQSIPSANVVVTNPTHYAVALKYADGMIAPQVVAKGALKLAEKIIETARENKVAIMRVPGFTRALYFHTEIEQDIPYRLYAAAAQVLAYIYQLKIYETQGGLAPVFPGDIAIPADLDPQNKRSKNILQQ